MIIDTLAQPLRKARSVNQTSTSFVSKAPTATEPTGDAGTATGASVLGLQYASGGPGRNSVFVIPYGTGNENDTFSVRVIGWRCAEPGNRETLLWIPVVLVEVVVTLSTTVGVAGKAVVATERFADTIGITTGNANVSVDINSPADNTIATFLVALKGAQKLELSFSTNSSATDCNALLALL